MSLYAIKDAGDLIFEDIVSKKVTSIIDFANAFGVSLSADSVFATAKGQNRISFDQAKEGTITMTTQIADASMFAMILGSEIVSAKGDINVVEEHLVEGGKITLKETPKLGTIAVLINSSRVILSGDEVTATGKEITVDAIHNGQDVKVFFIKEGVDLTKFTVKSSDSAKAYKLTALTEAKTDLSGEAKYIVLTFPKVKPKSNLSFEFDATNPSEFSMEFDILADANGTMLDWVEAE